MQKKEGFQTYQFKLEIFKFKMEKKKKWIYINNGYVK